MKISERQDIIFDSPYPFSNSYPMQASGGTGGGPHSRRANPYPQQDERAYEMADVGDSVTQLAPNGDSMASFYAEVSSCPFHSPPQQ